MMDFDPVDGKRALAGVLVALMAEDTDGWSGDSWAIEHRGLNFRLTSVSDPFLIMLREPECIEFGLFTRFRLWWAGRRVRRHVKRRKAEADLIRLHEKIGRVHSNVVRFQRTASK